jgi:hypothetical protein
MYTGRRVLFEEVDRDKLFTVYAEYLRVCLHV